MLLIHAWFQPYKKSWHNKLDAFLFFTLAVVNSLTMFKQYNTSKNIPVSHHVANIQILLSHLPLGYVLIYAFGSIFLKLKVFLSRKKMSECDNQTLTLSLLDQHERN